MIVMGIGTAWHKLLQRYGSVFELCPGSVDSYPTRWQGLLPKAR